METSKRSGTGRQTYNASTDTTSTGSQFIEHEFGAPEDKVTDQFSAEVDDEGECVECGGRLRNYDGGDRCVYCQDADRNCDSDRENRDGDCDQD